MRFSVIKSSLFLIPLLVVAVAIAGGLGKAEEAEAYVVSLTIEKTCDIESDQTFPITAHNASVTQSDQSGTPGCGDSFGVTLDAARLYDIYETVPDGWRLDSVDCSSDTTNPGMIFSSIPGDPSYGTDGIRIDTAGQPETVSVTCTFDNVFEGNMLTIVKDCGEDTESGPFAFNGVAHLPQEDAVDAEWDDLTLDCGDEESYVLAPAGNYTLWEEALEGWELTDVICETTAGIDDTDFIYEDETPDPVPDGVRLQVPDGRGRFVTCTFYNERLDEFEKYTAPFDNYVEPREEFSWFIQVPNTSDPWTLWDWLPDGFSVDGPIDEPDGVDCSVYGGKTIMCTGDTDETVIIEVPVRTSSRAACGEYTNRAKLIAGTTVPASASAQSIDGEWAYDTVTVVECRSYSSRTWLAGFEWRRGVFR